MENRSRISSKITTRLSRFQGPYLTALIFSNSVCDVRTYSILIGLMRKNRYIFTYIRLYHEYSINIMSVPSKILRSGSVVKEGDSKSVGREFEFSRRILDGQFSHWFVVTLYYLIKKIENVKDIESWGVVSWHSRQRPWFEPKHLHNLDICFCCQPSTRGTKSMLGTINCTAVSNKFRWIDTIHLNSINYHKSNVSKYN